MTALHLQRSPTTGAHSAAHGRPPTGAPSHSRARHQRPLLRATNGYITGDEAPRPSRPLRLLEDGARPQPAALGSPPARRCSIPFTGLKRPLHLPEDGAPPSALTHNWRSPSSPCPSAHRCSIPFAGLTLAPAPSRGQRRRSMPVLLRSRPPRVLLLHALTTLPPPRRHKVLSLYLSLMGISLCTLSLWAG
jgi:hypothetical protein